MQERRLFYVRRASELRSFLLCGEGSDGEGFYGRLSESFKVGQDDNGKNKYEFENWDARFVGAAKAKAEKLADGQSIVLTKWAARCPYSKDRKRPYPYLLVMDFEIEGSGESK